MSWGGSGELQRHALPPEQINECFVDERNDLLRGVQPLLRLLPDKFHRLFADAGDERLDHSEIDIRFD